MTVLVAQVLDVEPVDRAPLQPPSLPTMAEVEADPARSAVAAALAVHLARGLGLDTVAEDAVAALQACVERLSTS